MKKLLFVLSLVIVFVFAANAQSKETDTKKCDKTKVEKCCKDAKAMKNCDKMETTTTKTVKDGKEIVTKEVVMNKGGKKGKCCEKKSSCCDGKKEMKIEKKMEEKSEDK